MYAFAKDKYLMKKSAVVLFVLASTTSVMAEKASSVNTASVNTGKGFYLGGGAGSSRYLITLYESSYD